MTGQSLLFVEDVGDLKLWVDKRISMFQELNSPAHLLLQFMEQMIEDDILYLSHIESETEKMEENIGSGGSTDFFPLLTKHRQKLSELNAYYEQLTDIGELFQSRACSSFADDTGDWEKFTHRAERLQNHVQLLRENMLQLRELYQSMQDARQNKIMGILTIVTTFFLPLTLITGWYGMNFAYMPELKWRYGYLSVIIVSLIIAIGEIIYFKKKKFFNFSNLKYETYMGVYMDEIRQSPEHFLKEIEKEKQNLNRGHLKIFFGYAAGVGKTYAMLKAAHSVKRHGIDVVAGYIEPHARLQTSALVNGLECLPNLVSEYNGITLSEFNLDAALARHPQLILVDELAHTNAPRLSAYKALSGY